GEQGDRGDEGDAGAHGGDDPPGSLAVAGEQGQDEDAEVAGDAGEVVPGFLDALGPTEAQRGPGDEGGEQAQSGEGREARSVVRQRADERPDEDRPPDRD